MLVGNTLHQSPLTLNPTDLSDFVNMDLFTTQSSTTSGSREPSPSLSTPLFSPLPIVSEPNPSDWFNFSLEDDFVKTDQSALPHVPGVPWDFLALPTDSPDSGNANTGSVLSPSFAIDPQLMSSSVPPEAPDFGEAKDIAENGHEDEDGEEDAVTPSPVKVGGKGKSRKGTVQSGGVQKKTTISAVVRDTGDPREDSDDWRPSPEEYKKMSSKEKRQLRNKISARNFRVRRKEYITTLEGDIAERDRLIDAIRTELGSSQSENAALKQEISALKKALLACAGRADSPALLPPGPIPSSQVTRPTTGSSLVTPNTQKDLPSSPRLSGPAVKAFWGGSTSFGGVTPVHTTLIPENFAQPLASVKPLAGAREHSLMLQENINPLLNAGKSGLSNNAFGTLPKPIPFDSYTEANSFTMKMLDPYRMQFWTRIAQHLPRQSHQQPNNFMSPHDPLSFPHSLLSGKHLSTYPSPSSSPELDPWTPFISSKDIPTPQEAVLATLASHTLLQRLSSAFCQAFTAHSPSNEPTSKAGAPTWDADKARRVLEGNAIVSVVDIEPEVKTHDRHKGCSGTTALEESMQALNVSKD
ncbi:hypothetical protein F5148DRAFT_1197394 [Russula earlei]|uniref:Uncharacterized protein n=1 Tax=Russula earlei TaxID=71964 RepID=A0ACC0U9P7_9AGAM|nr:hypothetical protein F5148DRAFT_1197394 [Russula earlei]